ncbi:hypothetical protein, partial [Paenibacillus apiarius]|uniref:hypothetical protein n=1 Tax=Paenibacillus apiarius TaxID=46240 RepID=UPI003B3A5174
MRLETLNGTTINAAAALQYLLGKTEIQEEDGTYILDIQDEAEEIVVTVDYKRDAYDGERHNIGTNCVFNVVYSTDSFGQNPFSFETLIQDLHDQHLEEVEAWLYDAALKY